jgi:hypothetical protein
MSENERGGLALQEAASVVDAVDTAKFSAPAQQVLRSKIEEYCRALVAESHRLRMRADDDVVSATHVRRAAENLIISSPPRWLAHIGALGGIFMGAAISNILAMATTSQYSRMGVITTGALAILGATGLTVHYTRE